MRRDDLVRRVADLAQGIADRLGVELVDVEVAGEGARTTLRVYVDRVGGVGVDDCARMSEMLSRQLDIEEPFAHHYTLEVASPGLDRPLRRAADFDRFAGRLAEITTAAPVEGQRRFAGRLLGITAGRVGMVLEDGRELRVRLDEIAQARLRVDPDEIRQDLKRGR
ncbi:MAG: ribosome maturation factor RimP [Armatimonadota bacterium]|nr:ribosome maturation factor RimP [Armatimonadota bacterium]MDR5697570.1 ribosome maturation factor RimP [Armatimonadota bacterium]